MAVVQEPVQYCRGDDGVTEQLTPFAKALVRSEDDAAPLVASRYQGEEGGGRLPVVGPDAEFVDDEHLGWTFRISSGVSEGIDKSVVQSDWEFLRIGVDSRR